MNETKRAAEVSGSHSVMKRTFSFNSDDDDLGDVRDVTRRLEMLHLILPLSVTPIRLSIEDQGLGGPGEEGKKEQPALRGYETLQELRDRAAAFRQGYLNWRQFKARGAKGETTDIFTKRMETIVSASVGLQETEGVKRASIETQELQTERTEMEALRVPPLSPPPTELHATQSIDVGAPLQHPGHPLWERQAGEPTRAGSRAGSFSRQGLIAAQHASKGPLGISPATTTGALSLPPTSGQKLGEDIEARIGEYEDKLELVHVPKRAEEEDQWLRFYFNPFTPAEGPRIFRVNSETLKDIKLLHKNAVRIPEYNRDLDMVENYIMHLGVGQFHRSHQLVYMDDLLSLRHNAGADPSHKEGQQSAKAGTHGAAESSHHAALSPQVNPGQWGYCGVGLMPFDAKMATALRKQDLLYTVLSRTNTTSAVRVIGSMLDYIFAYEEPERAFQRLIDPKLRIISLTVTEKGYCQNVSGNLDRENPLIQSDLELLKEAEHDFPSKSPQSAIGFLYLGLRERLRRNLLPFTVMSCDNLPENGHVARHMVIEFASYLDPCLAEVISTQVKFPSTMVDRITPVVVEEHREILMKDYGIYDEWPVVTEDFRQWVIEDHFGQQRPHWEAVGALLVDDVKPFEIMKLRLLNGGHSMIGYISYLAGYQFVDDAVSDVRLSSYLRAYMDEVTSTIRNVSVELERYKEKIVERFGNRLMKDTLLRLCEDGSTKLYNTQKDALTELILEDRHVHWTALGVAAFILFLATAPASMIKDAKKECLIPLALKALEDPTDQHRISAILKHVFGLQLAESPAFVHQVLLALFTLNRHSIQSVINAGGVLECLFHKHILSTTHLKSILDLTTTPPTDNEVGDACLALESRTKGREPSLSNNVRRTFTEKFFVPSTEMQ